MSNSRRNSRENDKTFKPVASMDGRSFSSEDDYDSASDGQALDDTDHFVMKIVAERSQMPDPSESSVEVVHPTSVRPPTPPGATTSARQEQQQHIASQMTFDSRGHPTKNTRLPDGAEAPGAYSGAPGTKYTRNESARLEGLGAAWDSRTGSDDSDRDETATGPPESSNYDDNDSQSMLDLSGHTTNSVASKGYLENVAPSRGLAVFLGVFLTLILVVPVTLASTRAAPKSDNTNATASNTTTNASDLVFGSADSINYNLTDEFMSTINETTLERIHDLLPNSTLQTILDEEDRSAPSFKAYEWLLQDPQLDTLPDWRIQQRMALATFYFAFNGPRWEEDDPQASQWLIYDMEECNWWKTTRDACHNNGTMARLDISNLRGFRGSMPDEIGLLTHLEAIRFDTLELFSRPLTHLITPAMQQLTALATFACTKCDLDRFEVEDETVPMVGAPMPENLQDYVPYLQELDLSNSLLTGTIPTTLGDLSQLTTLHLGSNQLEGTLPTELGQLTNLHLLWVQDNQLREAVPDEMWLSLTSLNDIDVSANRLRGSIATEIGLWTDLRHFDAKGSNQLNGGLPSEIGLLSTNLEWLKLGGNRLRGSLPAELAALTAMRVLGLVGNEMTGEIEPFLLNALPQMTNLQELALGGNQFVGSINLTAAAESSMLELFDIADNLLDGTIPTEFGLMTGLTSLTLDSNALEGSLPSELGLLTDLELFAVNDNEDVLPEVPQELCDAVPQLDFSNFMFGWCEDRNDCCAP